MIRGSAPILPANAHALTDACVVVVDDHEANCMLLERMLRSVGIADIHTVTDARQAVERCAEVGADLVLLDLHMPHMDGHAVLRELQARQPVGTFLPVLVLTADTTVEARDRALQAGAKDFLTKPLDYTEVILRVRNLLETRALYGDLEQRNEVLATELETHEAPKRDAKRVHMERVRRIDAALAAGAFQMAFQPIRDLGTGAVAGVEALARFGCEPVRPPNVWFDEAAAVGRGAELELAAAQAGLGCLATLPASMFVSINVSPCTAMSPQLAALLGGYDATRIVLELTEHAPVEDYPLLLAALGRLRDRGLRIAVDDAGTGYAGLVHLLQLRPQVTKLDIALTRDIDTDPARRALATALVVFAAEIDSTIVAEGIETEQELVTLREIGIRLGQGYHLGRPDGLAQSLG